MNAKIDRFPDGAALAREAAAEWLRLLQEGAGRRKAEGGLYTVALSGGRIAKDFFGEIATQARTAKDFDRDIFGRQVHFFWGDERCVPPDDPESNFGVAEKLLFAPLQIAATQVHRVRGEAAEAEALGEVTEALRRIAKPGWVGGVPVLDMVFLGMGEDGHVASLFPGERPEVMSDPAVYRAVTAVKPPPRRITVGYGVLAAAERVWVLASGKGKEQALKESLSPQGKTPLARVLKSREETRILTDVAVG
jgi:6-phosphogluconolactonase